MSDLTNPDGLNSSIKDQLKQNPQVTKESIGVDSSDFIVVGDTKNKELQIILFEIEAVLEI